MKKIWSALVILGMCVCLASAQDKAMTNQERLEDSDVVVTGTVSSIQKFTDLGEQERLLVAVIDVEKFVKANQKIEGKKVEVYFLNGDVDSDEARAKYVELSQGQKGDFYLDLRPLFAQKDVLFIDHKTDVQKANSIKN